MNRHFKRRFVLLPLLCGILTGCEKPALRSVAEEEREPVAPLAHASAPAPMAGTPAPAPASAVATPAPERPTAEPLPMEDPVFKMWQHGKTITIEGALKSRIQVNRIVDTVKETFPDAEIVNDLKVEPNRYPVGWGNRLADELLVPYFQEVKSPGVAYQKGIVTLLGEVESTSRHRALTEIAINAFADTLTRDVDNKITTRE